MFDGTECSQVPLLWMTSKVDQTGAGKQFILSSFMHWHQSFRHLLPRTNHSDFPWNDTKKVKLKEETLCLNGPLSLSLFSHFTFPHLTHFNSAPFTLLEQPCRSLRLQNEHLCAGVVTLTSQRAASHRCVFSLMDGFSQTREGFS